MTVVDGTVTYSLKRGDTLIEKTRGKKDQLKGVYLVHNLIRKIASVKNFLELKSKKTRGPNATKVFEGLILLAFDMLNQIGGKQ